MMNDPTDTTTPPETAATPFISISREELAALPIRVWNGPIHLIDRDDAVAPACADLRTENLLGFDTETRPSFRVGESYPPALIQLAGERTAYVFQLQKLSAGAVRPLLDILADAAVTKAGVALHDDLKKLRVIYDFTPAGFSDIAPLARERGYKQTGLRALSGLLLGFRITKREQRSNWAAPKLTPGQIAYAATDAWATRELFLRLTHGGPLIRGDATNAACSLTHNCVTGIQGPKNTGP